MGTTVYFATGNAGKLMEAQEILSARGIKVERVDLKRNEIRSDSVKEVAIEAVEAAFSALRKPVFLDDTGLFIDALNGFPGTYSAWALSKIGLKGVLKLMEGVRERGAAFRTCVAYKAKDGPAMAFEADCEGEITTEERGTGGFGYDPVFVPKGYKQTFAESKELKNKLSHRYKALVKLANYIAE